MRLPSPRLILAFFAIILGILVLVGIGEAISLLGVGLVLVALAHWSSL